VSAGKILAQRVMDSASSFVMSIGGSADVRYATPTCESRFRLRGTPND
jgi:hypothetical protein